MPHLHQRLQRLIASVKAVRDSPNRVIRLLQSFDADADAYFGKFFAERNNPVGKISVRRNDNSVRFLIQFSDNLRNILPYKRFSAGDIGKGHLRQFPDVFQRNLLVRPGWVAETVTHIAMGIASIGYDDSAV